MCAIRSIAGSVLERAVVVAVLAFVAIYLLRAGAQTASAASPGGVSGPALWFAASGYNGTTWTDQSGSGSVSAQPAATSGYTSPGTVSLDANFNPGVSFNGSTQELMGTTSTAMFAEGNSYMFGVANSAVYAPGIYAYGDVLAGWVATAPLDGQGIAYLFGQYFFDASGAGGASPFTVPTATTILSDVAYPTAGNGTNASASENGLTQTTSLSNSTTASTQFEIGARTSGGSSCGCQNRLFTGTIDEVVYYDNLASALSTKQIAQIRSYLAMKYGITLGFNTQTQTVTGTDYLSSAGVTIWSVASTATYDYDVAGIGKDASSGLDQRVSHSINSSSYGNAVDVTIANGTSISTASQFANAGFSSDGTFVIWGDNGGATTMSDRSGIYRMARVWRTQTTGSGSTNLTVQVPATFFTGLAKPAIWVASDANFQTSAAWTLLSCNATYCTATIPTFSSSSSQYFSFGSEPIPAISVVLSVSSSIPSPGTTVTYMSTFTNSGYGMAYNLALTDPMPTNVDFKVGSVTTSLGSTGLTANIVYSNDSGATWTYTPVSAGGGAASGYDRNVTNLKVAFGGSLDFSSSDNSASFSFSAQVR